MNLLDFIQLSELEAKQESSIRWGSTKFSKPVKLDVVNEIVRHMPTESFPGLYAIMIPDTNFSNGFRPLWFGQAKDVYERARTHEQHSEWKRIANGKTLYVAYCHMFSSTKKERETVESSLITRYRSWLCNEKN